jgi:hypothetical protein
MQNAYNRPNKSPAGYKAQNIVKMPPLPPLTIVREPPKKKTPLGKFLARFARGKVSYPLRPRLFLVEILAWLGVVLVVVPALPVVMSYILVNSGAQDPLLFVKISPWIAGAAIVCYFPRLAWVFTRSVYFTIVGTVILIIPGVPLMLLSLFLELCYAVIFKVPVKM